MAHITHFCWLSESSREGLIYPILHLRPGLCCSACKSDKTKTGTTSGIKTGITAGIKAGLVVGITSGIRAGITTELTSGIIAITTAGIMTEITQE